MGKGTHGRPASGFRRSTTWRVTAFVLAGVGWISTFLGAAVPAELADVAERLGVAWREWFRWIAVGVGILTLAVVYVWRPLNPTLPPDWTAGWGRSPVSDEER